MVKIYLPVMQETWVQSLGLEDPLEKGMATHSSILAWRIPWTEGYSPWGQKELDMTEQPTLSLSRTAYCVLTLYLFIVVQSISDPFNNSVM